MSSGYFPQTPKDDWGKLLTEANRLIREVVERWQDSTCYLNGEDQAQDQSYVDELHTASAHIGVCLRLDESDPEAVEKKIAEMEKSLTRTEDEIERLRGIRAKLKAAACAAGFQNSIKEFVEGKL